MTRDQFYEAMKKKLQEKSLPQKDYERLIRKLEVWLDEVYGRE